MVSTHIEKKDLKVDVSIQMGRGLVWQPGGTFNSDLT